MDVIQLMQVGGMLNLAGHAGIEDNARFAGGIHKNKAPDGGGHVHKYGSDIVNHSG
jgi:hypothetical protein